jgi:DNA-binding CsgD family transcriptional regulator
VWGTKAKLPLPSAKVRLAGRPAATVLPCPLAGNLIRPRPASRALALAGSLRWSHGGSRWKPLRPRWRVAVHNPELARRAFDAVANMGTASSFDQLDEIARAAVSELGFSYISGARFFTSDHRSDPEWLFGRQDCPWAARFMSKGYAGISRIAREMLVNSRPYSWLDVANRGKLDAATRGILNHAREHGYTNGLYSPMRGPDGSYLAVVLCGIEADLGDPLVRTASEVLCAYYGLEGLRLLAHRRQRPALSPRQRECLAWVRHGKSSSDISQILGLSVPTVDGHVADACRRLGVRTRVQAAVEASLAGLLDGYG